MASSRATSPSVAGYHKPRIQWLALFLALAGFLSLAQAQASTTVTAPPAPAGTLLMDSRVPVMVDGRWTMMSQEEHELRRRVAAPAKPPSTTADSDLASASPTKSATTTAPASPLPSPFDGNIGTNFTSESCPNFINGFLNSQNFKACYPLSMLLQGSTSFFAAEKSPVAITQTLDTACAANVTFCTTYLNDLATNLTDASNCGADYQLGNDNVVRAYTGMIAYQALYTATCLQDPETSAYCFANAVTNQSSPSNVYLYYLPLNNTLPGSSVPSCNWCVQQVMSIFQAATSNRKLPIAYTYTSAAQQVDTLCGPTFTNETLPIALVQNAGPHLAPTSSWLVLVGALAAAAHLLL